MVHKVAKHGNLFLELHLDRHELEKKAKQACIDLLPDWTHLSPEAIQVSEISGGITNVLWQLHAKGESLDAVVVRIFGEQTDKIIDRDQEKRVLASLNQAGFGAQVLATFENGRIEEYLQMRPLKPEEMAVKSMAERIAGRLRQFHSVKMEGPAEPQLFGTISQWLRQARDLDFDKDAAKAKGYQEFDFERMQRSLTSVQELAQKFSPHVCFAHNDLLSGNILIPEQENSSLKAKLDVQFIDFEYSGFAYSTYDIANHFCEYAGLECDHSRFPNDDHICKFLNSYLFGVKSKIKEADAVEKAKVECKLFSLASHQYWGTWGILQAKYSPIRFDYIGYAKLRWDEVFRRETEFLEQAQSWLENSKGKHED